MFTSGFFNSVNSDRKYNAEQMSAIFDGLITDGIFDTIGDHFQVTPGNDLTVSVGTGRAWLNQTWSYNDSLYPLQLSAASPTLARKDLICIKVDKSNAVRANSIVLIEGTPASTPVEPTVTDDTTNGIYYHKLAAVTVPAGATSISAANIQNYIGLSTGTPYVTGIIETTAVDELWSQWDGEFNDWWENTIKPIINTETVTRLQNNIDHITPKETTMNLYGFSHLDPPPSGKTYQEYSTDAILNQISSLLNRYGEEINHRMTYNDYENLFNVPMQEDIVSTSTVNYTTTSTDMGTSTSAGRIETINPTMYTTSRYGYIIFGESYTIENGVLKLVSTTVKTFSYNKYGTDSYGWGVSSAYGTYYIKGSLGTGYSSESAALSAGESIKDSISGTTVYKGGGSGYRINITPDTNDGDNTSTAYVYVTSTSSYPGKIIRISSYTTTGYGIAKQKLSADAYTASELTGNSYTLPNIGKALTKVFVTSSSFSSTSTTFSCPFLPLFIAVLASTTSGRYNVNFCAFIDEYRAYDQGSSSGSTYVTATYSASTHMVSLTFSSSITYGGKFYCFGI